MSHIAAHRIAAHTISRASAITVWLASATRATGDEQGNAHNERNGSDGLPRKGPPARSCHSAGLAPPAHAAHANVMHSRDYMWDAVCYTPRPCDQYGVRTAMAQPPKCVKGRTAPTRSDAETYRCRDVVVEEIASTATNYACGAYGAGGSKAS